jgi:hypothetical protein
MFFCRHFEADLDGLDDLEFGWGDLDDVDAHFGARVCILGS